MVNFSINIDICDKITCPDFHECIHNDDGGVACNYNEELERQHSK